MMSTRLRWAAPYRSLAHLRTAGAGGRGGQGGVCDLVGAVVRLLL